MKRIAGLRLIYVCDFANTICSTPLNWFMLETVGGAGTHQYFGLLINDKRGSPAQDDGSLAWYVKSFITIVREWYIHLNILTYKNRGNSNRSKRKNTNSVDSKSNTYLSTQTKICNWKEPDKTIAGAIVKGRRRRLFAQASVSCVHKWLREPPTRAEGFPCSVIQYGRRPRITVNSIKLVPYKVSARS